MKDDSLYRCIEYFYSKGMQTPEVIDEICYGLYGEMWWVERMKIRKILKIGAIYEPIWL
jgi:hypothetical protein